MPRLHFSSTVSTRAAARVAPRAVRARLATSTPRNNQGEKVGLAQAAAREVSTVLPRATT